MKGRSFQDDYKLYRLLGKDSHSEIYHCVNKSSKLDRAVKIYRKEKLGESKENQKRFLDEIEILRQLDHPNIVKVFEIYADFLNFYLV